MFDMVNLTFSILRVFLELLEGSRASSVACAADMATRSDEEGCEKRCGRI